MAATLLGLAREPDLYLADNSTVRTTRPRQQNFLAATGKTLDYRQKIAAYQSDGVTVDTSFTGAITAAITVGTCTLGGTVTRNAVAGIADFSDLKPATGTGDCAITFTAAGLTAFTTATFPVYAPTYDAYALARHGHQTELPRVRVDTTLPTVFARTIHVGPGQSIVNGVSYQSISAALAYCADPAHDITGNTQLLCDVATYAETVTYPTRAAGMGWIVLRPATMPCADDTRVALTSAASLPKISISNANGMIQCALNAHHIILAGFDVLIPVPAGALATTIYSGVSTDAPTTLFSDGVGPDNTEVTTLTSIYDLPHHLGFDRCLFHSADITQTNLRRVVRFNTRWSYIANSVLNDGHEVGNGDTNAISMDIGLGPVTITNCDLNSAGEVIMCGGADPMFYDMKVRDVFFSRNLLHKPSAWIGDDNYQSKNIHELKSAERWLAEGNVVPGYSWTGAQNGTAWQLASMNQSTGGGASTPRSVSRNYEGNADITIRLNYTANAVAFMSANAASTVDCLTMRRLSVHDNLAVNINAELLTVARYDAAINRLGLTGTGLIDVVNEHNTVLSAGWRPTIAFTVDNPVTQPNATTYVRNNILTCESYGIGGTGTGVGTSTTDPAFPDDTLPRNVFITGPNTGTNNAYGTVHGVGTSADGSHFPPDSYYPALVTDVGFVDDAITGSWETAHPLTVVAALALASGSAYKGVADDGTDPGADMVALAAAIDGVMEGVPSGSTAPVDDSNTTRPGIMIWSLGA